MPSTAYTYDGMNQQLNREMAPTVRVGRDSGDFVVTMEEPMNDQPSQPSMFSQEVSHARTTQWQASVTAWLATVARSGGSSIASLVRDAPDGLSQRMSLGSSLAEVVETSPPSSTRSWASGMASSGVCLTLNGSEWPSDGAVCTLSDILEANPDPKYLLSPKACRGILNRAEKRGRRLPPSLEMALVEVADTDRTPL